MATSELQILMSTRPAPFHFYVFVFCYMFFFYLILIFSIFFRFTQIDTLDLVSMKKQMRSKIDCSIVSMSIKINNNSNINTKNLEKLTKLDTVCGTFLPPLFYDFIFTLFYNLSLLFHVYFAVCFSFVLFIFPRNLFTLSVICI